MLCQSCLRARVPRHGAARAITRQLASRLPNSNRRLSHLAPSFQSAHQSSRSPPSGVRTVVSAWIPTRYYSATATAPSSQAASEPASATESGSLEKPDFLDDAESVIWDRLAAEFTPHELVVRDISGGCGSMYGIEISSEKFRGASMLKQQRMVNGVLGDLMKEWHGVQLRTRAP